MENSISRQNVNVNVRAIVNDPNVTVQYKTKVLQKNVVNGVNTLTPAMISEANTKYIIKYDYTLSDNITIPENCVLEFDGGSISGEHTITGQNTGINAELVKIFNTNVTLAGTWNVVEAYPEWFGAKGDGVTDDTTSIQKLVNVSLSKKIIFVNTYLISSAIELTNTDVCICGISSGVESTEIISKIINNTSQSGIFYITTDVSSSVEKTFPCIRNIVLEAYYPIIFNSSENNFEDSPHGMKAQITNCVIHSIGDQVGNGITMIKCFDAMIENCHIQGFNIGVLTIGCDICLINNNRIQACNYLITNLSHGSYGSQVSITNNDLLGPKYSFIKTNDRHSRIINNYFEAALNPCDYGIDATNINFETIGVVSTEPNEYGTIVIRDNRFEFMPNECLFRLSDKWQSVIIDEPLKINIDANKYFKIVNTSGLDSYFKYWSDLNRVFLFDIKIGNFYLKNNTDNLPAVDFKDSRVAVFDVKNIRLPFTQESGNTKLGITFDNLIVKGAPIFFQESEFGELLRSTTYNIKLVCRSRSNTTVTFSLIRTRNGSGYDATIPCSVTSQEESFVVDLKTDASYNNQGIAILSPTSDIDIIRIELSICDSGTNGSRPNNPKIGFCYFDVTQGINKPIWYDGNQTTGWCDATGTPV